MAVTQFVTRKGGRVWPLSKRDSIALLPRVVPRVVRFEGWVAIKGESRITRPLKLTWPTQLNASR